LIERETRYWVAAQAGQKQNRLFEPGTASAWAWAKPAEFIRWRGDGERRYGTSCSKLASVALKAGEADPDYGHRKVWRQGLEVAMKIKGSQGKSGWSGSKLNIRLRRSVLPVMFMPITAEAQNSALRRRSSAYRRRQNLSAKRVEALQRVLSLQRLVHNGCGLIGDLKKSNSGNRNGILQPPDLSA
jgi:hypothetical protein